MKNMSTYVAKFLLIHFTHWQYQWLHIIHGCIWIFDHIIKCRNYKVSSGNRAVNLVTTLPFIYKLVLAPIINQRFLSVIDRQMIYCPNMKRMIDFPYWSIQWLIDDELYLPILSKLFITNSFTYHFVKSVRNIFYTWAKIIFNNHTLMCKI